MDKGTDQRKKDERINEMMRFRSLKMKMTGYESKYFDDMAFEKKSLLNSVAKVEYASGPDLSDSKVSIEDGFRQDLRLDDWLIAYEDNEKYKIEGKHTLGICFSESKTIIVRKMNTHREEKNIILHEMIHAFESILHDRLSQLLLLYLYRKLEKELGQKKLWRYIGFDNHVITMVNSHGPLFLLKSIELDIRTKQKLGTI